MARPIEQQAPAFTRTAQDSVHLTYDIELITPMVGGGVESWKPDTKNPARTQAIKGQLRFWWRTMQNFSSVEDLKAAEDALWGCTDSSSLIRIDVCVAEKVSRDDIVTIARDHDGYLLYSDAGVPDYVLFPLQSADDPCRLIKNLAFRLTVQCPVSVQATVENTIKLWVLFGGLGARITRGCGALYCSSVMADFPDGGTIGNFLANVSPENSAGFGQSPWPVLGNSRFGFLADTNDQDSVTLWCNYLTAYKDFRQGRNTAREPGHGSIPGRSKWPEPDAIRSKTGQYENHKPRHNDVWFPRAAYGLPILSRFNTKVKNGDPTDPRGDFHLDPLSGSRWPSPIILKIIKLADDTSAKIWLLLNHAIPEMILKSGRTTYPVSLAEHPNSFSGKQILHGMAIPASGTSPYDALINHLNIPEVI